MPEVLTHLLRPEDGNIQIYGALDAAITLEVHRALMGMGTNVIYDFERAMQAPAMDMMRRGFLIDEGARQIAIHSLDDKLVQLDFKLHALASAFWGKGLNPRSSEQLKDFFYGWLRCPEQFAYRDGTRVVSCNRECLERLEVSHVHARPFVTLILTYRDVAKRLEVLRSEIDPDGRMRTSFNIAGTETGRWSSSVSSFGTGGNLQNITADLRPVFVADPGWVLCGIDLEQAESREVGFQCGTHVGDWSYLDACEDGDLHTTVCRLTWPDLGWGSSPSENRKLAETPYYRHLTYRDMAKKLSHGSNYYGAPFTLAKHAKIPQKIAQDFQQRYFQAFPGIPRWHRWVAQQLQTTQQLTTPFGRTRQFFGRSHDDKTLREAIAYVPQSSTGDRMNLGLWRIWKHLPECQLLAQVHDAVYFQVRESQISEALLTRALAHVNVSLTDKGRTYTVPGELKTGYNWGNWHMHGPSCKTPCNLKENPNGLRKGWHPDRRRVELGLLDRRY